MATLLFLCIGKKKVRTFGPDLEDILVKDYSSPSSSSYALRSFS